jgi:uncharacterized protein (DUF1499 family)
MAQISTDNPLSECPDSPNCVRTQIVLNIGMEAVFEYLSQIFEKDAHEFHVKDPKRIELHAVYRIPLFGFKDDVNVILDEHEGKTIVYIRSASRVGEYDLGVNKRRVHKIFNKLENKIKN